MNMSRKSQNKTINNIKIEIIYLKPWYKNHKYKKIGLIVILSVAICALVIGLCVGLSSKSKKKIKSEEHEIIDFISYKISTLFFNSLKEEIIKTNIQVNSNDEQNKTYEEKKI